VSNAPDAATTHTSAHIGHPRVHLRRTDSTNERARTLALAGAPHGTLVTASEQTAGRGRQGRTWSAPAGSALLMSLLLRSPPALLPLTAAVAVCDALGQRFKIKWPNDIVVERDDRRLAKLAGILVEARLQQDWAVLGIGVNVAVRLVDLPEELRGGTPGVMPAASLELTPGDVEPTLAALIAALERRLSEPDAATLEAWRGRDALRGREIAWAGGQGRAEGIDGTGRLVVALKDGGRTALSAGEVHLLELGRRR
jgi:BirA family transcriptional regulator, biotin operon repressor / biotin---[acetyl-CoA-carboxylase] ligase